MSTLVPLLNSLSSQLGPYEPFVPVFGVLSKLLSEIARYFSTNAFDDSRNSNPQSVERAIILFQEIQRFLNKIPRPKSSSGQSKVSKQKDRLSAKATEFLRRSMIFFKSSSMPFSSILVNTVTTSLQNQQDQQDSRMNSFISVIKPASQENSSNTTSQVSQSSISNPATTPEWWIKQKRIKFRRKARYLLGSGGFGTLFQGKLTTGSSSIPVAVKLFAPIIWDPSNSSFKKSMHQFCLENALLLKLENSHIYQFFGATWFDMAEDTDSDDDDADDAEPVQTLHKVQFCQVFELLKENLREKLARLGSTIKLSLQSFCDIAIQAAIAIDYLHDCQPAIIHNDIKPSNFMFSNADEIKLIDFGLVDFRTLLSSLPTFMAHSKMSSGMTESYSAPERFKGEKPTTASDVWSFACVLLYIFTQDEPYTGLDRIALLSKVTTGVLPASNSQLSQFPEWLQRLLVACWNIDSKKRPSMSNIISALKSKEFTFKSLPSSAMTLPAQLANPDPSIEQTPSSYTVHPTSQVQSLSLASATTLNTSTTSTNTPNAAENSKILSILKKIPNSIYTPGSTPDMTKGPNSTPIIALSDINARVRCTIAGPLPLSIDILKDIHLVKTDTINQYVQCFGFYRSGTILIGINESFIPSGPLPPLSTTGDFLYLRETFRISGLRCQLGIHAKRDFVLALRYFEKAAVMGSVLAVYNLGRLLHLTGSPQQSSLARACYQMTANLGFYPGMERLAFFYRVGWDEQTPDMEKSTEILKQCIDGGYLPAITELGIELTNGQVGEINYPKGIELLTTASQKGYLPATDMLGWLYEHGTGVEKSATKAVEYYIQAQKYPSSSLTLGFYYRDGIYTPKDPAKAFHYFSLAAKCNDKRGFFGMAYCYEFGLGIPQSIEKAAILYRTSAEDGYAISSNNLGILYQAGGGVIQSHVLAAEWYKDAMEKNYALGFYNLGRLYRDGLGVVKDVQRAIQLFQSAIDLDSGFGYFGMGYCYDLGIGVPEDAQQALEYYLVGAKKQHAMSMNHIGAIYETGRPGVEKDVVKAAEYYKKGALLGEPASQANYAYCLRSGCGVPKDPKAAIPWYMKSAQQNNRQGLFGCGYCYYYGVGVEVDYKKAFEFYLAAAKLGYRVAMNNVAVCYEAGHGTERDLKKALEWYLNAANSGYVLAMSNAGFCYRDGIGCQVDYALAMEWFKKAADMNHDRGLFGLGYMYSKGLGVPVNKQLAFEYYKKSSDLGYPIATNNLGVCYQSGSGVVKDEKKAFECYEKAAKAGNALAYSNCGFCYRDAIGVEYNPLLAFENFKTSAEMGNTFGHFGLAYCYKAGIGCDVDFQLAFTNFTIAAKRGHQLSKAHLGHFYHLGLFVKVDKDMARKYYTEAADMGCEFAISSLKVLDTEELADNMQ